MVLTEFYDFKIVAIKWYLNFVSCNFGLKSLLGFQIELALHAYAILKSRYDFRPNCTPLSSITIMYAWSYKVHHSFKWVINQLVSPCRLYQDRLLTWKYFNMWCATDQTKKDMPLYFTPAMDMLPFRYLLLERISTNTVLKSSFKILVPLIPFFKNLVINTQE